MAMQQQIKNLYENDFFAWTQEQAYLIQEKDFKKLDLIHLQEELLLMGATERRELSSRLAVLLTHLLKWKYQPTHRSVSWEITIKEQRLEVKEHLNDNPSLAAKVNDYIIIALG